LGRSAASANVADLAIDVRVFLIKDLSRCSVDAGTSIARGWRWPTGADQGLVAVSCPAPDEWKGGADAMAPATPPPTTTASRR